VRPTLNVKKLKAISAKQPKNFMDPAMQMIIQGSAIEMKDALSRVSNKK
jgi:hypothetical protein